MTERAASTMSLIQTAPEAFVEQINQLPQERRDRARQFVGALSEQMKRDAPGIAGTMNFTFVLGNIKP